MGHKPADGESNEPSKEPSLELPSLSLSGMGRKQKKQKAEPASVKPREPVREKPAAVLEHREPLQPATVKAPIAFSLIPRVSAMTAVVVTGLLVGLFGTGATYGGLRGCEAVSGTQSCGRTGGFLLVAILTLMVLLGALLLRTCKVSDATSTSFLGVGLVGVVVLVALIDVILSPWMSLVIPLVTAGSFAAARWVATRFVDLSD